MIVGFISLFLTYSISVSRARNCAIDSKLGDLNLDVRTNATDMDGRHLTESFPPRYLTKYCWPVFCSRLNTFVIHQSKNLFIVRSMVYHLILQLLQYVGFVVFISFGLFIYFIFVELQSHSGI